MGRERRKAKRRMLRYRAWLVLADGSLSECVLSDISETGARLMVDDSGLVPEKFDLVFSRNCEARRHCKVVWRNPQQIGVQFEQIGASDLPAPAVPGSEPATSETVEHISLPT